ncbi:MAG TPA: FtsQ-type POTRA domain-containing protein [Actinomycetota bacterium]|nr:FtsQ-type POTRA domain-containing protein [Actinomycetota bacterium]
MSGSRRAERGLARWTSLALGLALVCGAAWWATNSSLFDLRSVSVEGAVHLSRAEVLRQAGLDRGTNVLWTQPGAVERRLERNPWVLEARVSRALPSSMSVAVRERVPVAMLGGPTPLLVAGDGTVLGPARGAWTLPALREEGLTVGPGGRLPASPALAAARALPPGLRARVADVSVEGGRWVSLTLRDGTEVLLGTPEGLEEKAASLQAVLAWARREGVRPLRVDVRVPWAPALMPAGPGPPPAQP